MKKFKKLKCFGIILLVIGLFFLIINIVPPTKVMEHNPFISESGIPMIAAHRGGGIENPENTLKAYKSSVYEMTVDIIESDLWLTKDGKLVYNHDETINRTSDVVEMTNEDKPHYVGDYTLDELKQFNFGYNFKNEEGQYPYRDLCEFNNPNRSEILKANDLQIVEVSELFEEFYEDKEDLLFIVEIKDGGKKGYQAANILDNLLTNQFPNYKNRVVIGTFHDEIEKDLAKNHPTLLTGASTGAATKFLVTQMFGVNLFYNGKFKCLQIPTSYNIKGIKLNLAKKNYIKRAHKKNIAVQYWTINDEKEMRELIELKCDAIMTDNPKLLREILNSYK